MELPTRALIDLLTYLLPGFIAAAILFSLTPSPKPPPFERIVQALIFTIVVQVVVLGVRHTLTGLGGLIGSVGRWSEESRLVCSVISAVVLGLLLAALANNDKLHSLLRLLRITNQTSYTSEWYGALSQNQGWLVLHMTGNRRLYGWPEEWPSVPDRGHFVIAQPQWLLQDGTVQVPTGVVRTLVPASDVELVEFVDRSKHEV